MLPVFGAERVVGDSVAVVPVGAPVTVSAASPAKPPLRVIVMVLVPFCPACTDNAAGAADTEIVGVLDAVTVRFTVAVCEVTPVPAAVTTTGYVPGVALVAAVNVSVLAVTPVPRLAGANAAVMPVGNCPVVSVTASV
ncbi:MAG: hypothetical protein K2R93_13585 [Gemmatimonadaceae bacterium]|nr:hypothetical protein [Gemmatimonadaceae bacterium]